MVNNYSIKLGRSFPLGATWKGNGTNFSVFAENADRLSS